MITIEELRLIKKHSRGSQANSTMLPGTNPSTIAKKAKCRTSEVKDFIQGVNTDLRIKKEMDKARITSDDLIVARIMLKHQKPKLWEL